MGQNSALFDSDDQRDAPTSRRGSTVTPAPSLSFSSASDARTSTPPSASISPPDDGSCSQSDCVLDRHSPSSSFSSTSDTQPSTPATSVQDPVAASLPGSPTQQAADTREWAHWMVALHDKYILGKSTDVEEN
eukprot:CAMPEP_0194299340 /NCGR_PEP_ID=MMETSP0169-20130528/60669_1 /TAXON_ID=218684 /ORGANISM="Corethron pennatum, Strain L29A3" /LENGTH=132 /DNA_ID=CAMNT_0039049429 /DNA_START=300 /DNA_END=695 /DNA_ORIENTATION=-